MRLYETHLPVRSTEQSLEFYRRVVGLEFAHRAPGRDVVFLWVGEQRNSMLGLWGPGTVYGESRHKQHLAIAVLLPELLAVGPRLNALGIPTRDFSGKATSEPSVIGWMPSAQLYFSDLDGHSLEFITLLDDAPVESFVGPLSRWEHTSRRG